MTVVGHLFFVSFFSPPLLISALLFGCPGTDVHAGMLMGHTCGLYEV